MDLQQAKTIIADELDFSLSWLFDSIPREAGDSIIDALTQNAVDDSRLFEALSVWLRDLRVRTGWLAKQQTVIPLEFE